MYQPSQVTTAPLGTAFESEKQKQLGDLSSRIEQFKGQALESMKVEAVDRGRKQAEEVFLSEGTHGELKDEHTVFADTYNKRLIHLGTKQTQIDIRTQSENIALETDGDPLQYDDLMNKYLDETIMGLPESMQPDMNIFSASVKAGKQGELNIRADRELKVKEKSIQLESDRLIRKDVEDSAYSGNHIKTATAFKSFQNDLEIQINNGLITDKEANLQLKDMQYRMTYATLDGTNDKLIEDGSLMEAQEAITEFSKTKHEFLDIQEREAITSRLQGQLNKAIASQNADDSAMAAYSKKELNEYINVMNKGEAIDPQRVSLYKSVLKGDDLRRFNNAVTVSSVGVKTKPSSPRSLTEMIESLEAKPTTSPVNERILSNLKRQQSQIQSRVKDGDALGVAIENGVVGDTENLDFKNIQDFSRVLTDREKHIQSADAYYNGNSGAFKKEEMEYMQANFGNFNILQKTAILSQISNLPKQRQLNTYKQLGKHFADFAMAGTLMDKNPNISQAILQGRMVKATKGYLEPKILTNKVYSKILLAGGLSTSLTSDMSKQVSEMYTQSVGSLYAKYAMESENELELNAEGMPILNEDIMDRAIQEVTGGIHKINGKTFIAPKYGMKEDDAENWLDDLSMADIDGMGGFFGTGKDAEKDNTDTLEAIKTDPNYKLESIGQGRYLIKIGTKYLGNKDNKNFILTYEGK